MVLWLVAYQFLKLNNGYAVDFDFKNQKYRLVQYRSHTS